MCVIRITRNAKPISESIYLGHINKSTDTTNVGIVMNIKIGLTFKVKRLFAKIINDKNKNNIFKNKKAYCHSVPKKNLQKATKITGVV